MSFTPEQTAQLSAKLDALHVKTRKQGGSQVSYVEAWHVIAEANRIFGFDGWARETLSTECVYSGNYEKPVWENGRKTGATITSFRCTYNARVRVTAGGVFRDGTGSGHGFGDNPGDAHESAVKEAETDAMKRALMTFGNPFGLALYDKGQENVEHHRAADKPKPAPSPARETPGKFELLDADGKIAEAYESAEMWCHGLREAITAEGARVAALWQMNATTAQVIYQHYPDVVWAGKTGRKVHAVELLEAKVNQLLPGLAA